MIPPQALGFGSLVHKVHERWLLDPTADPQNLVLEETSLALTRVKEAYFKAIGAPVSDEELTTFYEDAILGREIFKNYKAQWGSALPEGYALVAPEQTILTPIPNTLHFLEGTLDALIRNSAGLLFVLERKTYGNRPQLEVLEETDQFLAYDWMLSKLDLGAVGGVLYDGMWKRSLEGKRTLPDLFTRHVITHAPQELEMFERNLAREANDMYEASQDPDKIYLNIPWQGCWDCSFRTLCLAERRGEDADWIRQEKFTKREGAEWLEVVGAD